MKVLLKLFGLIVKIVVVLLPLVLLFFVLISSGVFGILLLDSIPIFVNNDKFNTTDKYNIEFEMEEKFDFLLPSGGNLIDMYISEYNWFRGPDQYFIYQYSNMDNSTFVELGFGDKDSVSLPLNIFESTFEYANVPEEHIFDSQDDYIVKVTTGVGLGTKFYLFFDEKDLLYIYSCSDLHYNSN